MDGKAHKRDVRKLSDMVDVMAGDVDLEDSGNVDMYYMYREVARKGDLRYDITVVPPRVLEKEFAKTFGHYHAEAENGLSYPEVYQVLRGGAIFILQKPTQSGGVDVSVVGAGLKDVVLVPPNYGHVTINPTPNTLVMSNLVSSSFGSIYSDFRKNRGAAYYLMEGGDLVHNPNYFVQKNERVRAAQFNQRFGFQCKDLLAEFMENPARFSFLETPSLLFKR